MKHYIKNFGQFSVNEQAVITAAITLAAAKKLYNKLDPDTKKVVKKVVDPFDISGKLKDNKENIKKKLKKAAEVYAKGAKQVIDPLGLYSSAWKYVSNLF